MKLHFLGANRQVTGSRYCLEAAGIEVMIDCGMFQERAFVERNWSKCPLPAERIDAMLLTHAHVDHCGLIPRLVKEGFRAPIHATRPTTALAEIILRDSARIQSEDAEYKKKRHRAEGRAGRYPEVALYEEEDVERALPLFKGLPYQKELELAPGFTVRFHDAGHMLGSAMLEIVVTENGTTRRLLFSGDIGQWGKPLLRDPTLFEQADYVVMEATYGDRNHENGGDVVQQIRDVINQTVSQGGNVVVPTFAVERAQELMYHISHLVRDNKIPDLTVFLDSPMAIDATRVFQRSRDCFDQETWERMNRGDSPLHFPGLRFCATSKESRAINDCRQPCIIMATSGMCTAGRIKHHLRHNITHPKNTILFVGYQGRDTLGRQILDGAAEVRIHGGGYPVRARIAQIFGFSGHADRAGLLRWLGHLKSPPRRIFLTHGEEEAANSLAAHISGTMGWPVTVPSYLECQTLD